MGANDRVGKVLAGKYRLEALLGIGGMAHAYRAVNEDIGRPVAIKILGEISKMRSAGRKTAEHITMGTPAHGARADRGPPQRGHAERRLGARRDALRARLRGASLHRERRRFALRQADGAPFDAGRRRRRRRQARRRRAARANPRPAAGAPPSARAIRTERMPPVATPRARTERMQPAPTKPSSSMPLVWQRGIAAGLVLGGFAFVPLALLAVLHRSGGWPVARIVISGSPVGTAMVHAALGSVAAAFAVARGAGLLMRARSTTTPALARVAFESAVVGLSEFAAIELFTAMVT